jgi:Acetyltransferase (GNAT) family
MITIEELRSEDDYEKFIVLAKMKQEELAPFLSFDEQCVRSYFDTIKHDVIRDDLNCFIAKKDNEVIGFVVCYVTRYFFTSQTFSLLDLWYVHPNYRGSYASFKLIKAYENWARLRGCIQIFAAVTNDADHSKAVAIADIQQRLGYKSVGFIVAKRTTE